MKKVFNLIAFTAFILAMFVGSGTGQAAPANSVTFVESQAEVIELSAWPRIRDALLGREHHRRHDPPPPPPRGPHFGPHHGPHFGPPPPRGPHRYRR